jgi:hypothetical protein
MGIKVKPDNTTAQFSLDWLFTKFEQINEEQLRVVFGMKHGNAGKDRSGRVLKD